MEPNKSKEGVSVREIEDFAKKHRFEVFFCLAFAFACFFSFIFSVAGWSLITAAVGGVLGVLLSGKVEHFCKKILHFVFKQESTTQLVLAVVVLVLSIVVSPLVFFILGLHGGKDMHHWALEVHAQCKRR
jgi:hypothetical protein